jgi:hypothetical protein
MNTRMPAAAVPATRMFPVSVKGVAVQAGKVLLLENERAECELPHFAAMWPRLLH